MQTAYAITATLRSGTRGSPLALAQAEELKRALAGAGGLEEQSILIVPIRTNGDRINARPLSEAGGKGLFTKAIDDALLAGTIDIAVHSAKDLPTLLPDGIVIAGCLPRADVRDAFISRRARTLTDLPSGAVVGTASLRRSALTLRARPDLKVVSMRGNVDTRLRKLDAGEADANILAFAGLARLGLSARITSPLGPDGWLPAAGQGAIAITARSADAAARALLARIDHRATSLTLLTERAFLARLDGSCRTPIGGLAEMMGDLIRFRGIIVKPDGSAFHEVERRGSPADGERIGDEAGGELARRGGADFFA
ncbi:hydroxymethylbilane synthase [soil metagenome]